MSKPTEVNGQPGMMFTTTGGLIRTCSALTLPTARIQAIHAAVNPGKLRNLGPVRELNALVRKAREHPVAQLFLQATKASPTGVSHESAPGIPEGACRLLSPQLLERLVLRCPQTEATSARQPSQGDGRTTTGFSSARRDCCTPGFPESVCEASVARNTV